MLIGPYSHLYKSFRLEYEGGKNIYQIAKQFGASPETVRKGVRRAGGQIFRRARKYFVDAKRERQIKAEYGLTFSDMQFLWRIQKGMCLWCRAPLPKEVLRCVVDHIGGRKTYGQKNKVRGLCCSSGHCNRMAGFVQTGKLQRNSLFYAFVNRVHLVLRTNKGGLV